MREEIRAHPGNAAFTAAGWEPIFTASAAARILVVGQAPGRRAQESAIPWDDASGARLFDWLGVSEAEFRDPERFAMLPMDFYYPGRGTGGDLPPRPGFAARWHPPLLALMPRIRLTLLIGRYAHQHYLPELRRSTLTAIVRDWRSHLPGVVPLVHPSPLNFRWQARNPWFVDELVPELRQAVAAQLGRDASPS
nr:uracil-DNA glycosylase family protein [Schumannella luteola]